MSERKPDPWAHLVPHAVFEGMDGGPSAAGDGERPEYRDAIGRMTKQLVDSGMPASEARDRAVSAARRRHTHYRE